MKDIKNGKGTTLHISETSYIKVGEKGDTLQIRANGEFLSFDQNGINRLVEAIDKKKADYSAKDITK